MSALAKSYMPKAVHTLTWKSVIDLFKCWSLQEPCLLPPVDCVRQEHTGQDRVWMFQNVMFECFKKWICILFSPCGRKLSFSNMLCPSWTIVWLLYKVSIPLTLFVERLRHTQSCAAFMKWQFKLSVISFLSTWHINKYFVFYCRSDCLHILSDWL